MQHPSSPPRHGPDLQYLLSSLLERRVPRVDGLPPVPARLAERLVAGGVLAPVTTDLVADLTPEELDRACRCVLGPWLYESLLPVLSPTRAWSALPDLPAPPLGLPRVIEQLSVMSGPVALREQVDVLSHLEHQISLLGDDIDQQVSQALGLPAALGRIIDLLVLARERGGPRPQTMSAALPLLHVLDMLGLSDVFALLPAVAGEHAELSSEVPVETLTATMQGLYLLGAPATTVRLLVLLVLVTPPGRFPRPYRQLLRHLLVAGAAAVPPKQVIDVWKLTFD